MQPSRSGSPDFASHAANIYDATETEGQWEEETDDDDMDFEPSKDESEDAEFFDPLEDPEAEFHDAEDGMSGVEMDFPVDGGESTAQEDEGNEMEIGATSYNSFLARILSIRQIMSPISHRPIR